MLERINAEPTWRKFLRNPEPDIHMKDIEVLLRIFAILVDKEIYAPSLVKFLNQFSNKAKTNTPKQNEYLEDLFKSFLNETKHLTDDTFINKSNGRFNIALIEAVFYAVCKYSYAKGELLCEPISAERIRNLEVDAEFVDAATSATTSRRNVEMRLERGVSILNAN